MTGPDGVEPHKNCGVQRALIAKRQAINVQIGHTKCGRLLMRSNAAGEGLADGAAGRQSSREAATSTGLLEGGKDKA